MKMISRSRNPLYYLPVASLLALIVVINVTDPTENMASILLVFLLLYALFISLVYMLLSEGLRLVSYMSFAKTPIEKIMSRRRAYYVSGVLAFVLISLLAMQSLNQLRVLDLLLVGVLAALAVFYIYKRIP